jgi:uncharacterized protein (TIGR02391 family)
MPWNRSFFELVNRIPSPRRTDAVHVLLAIWRLQRECKTTTVPTGAIANFLKQQLRGRAPCNVSDALAKLPPYVERVGNPGKQYQWQITESGLRRLGDLSGLSFAKQQNCVVDLSTLHPRVTNAARELFLNGHYAEAAGRAAKELNRMVRERTNRSRDDGVAMMHQVFSETEANYHRLVVSALKEDWERDLQCGLRFMMAGCQSGIANVDKHGSLAFGSETEALECLTLISYLARQVDRAEHLAPANQAALTKAA